MAIILGLVDTMYIRWSLNCLKIIWFIVFDTLRNNKIRSSGFQKFLYHETKSNEKEEEPSYI